MANPMSYAEYTRLHYDPDYPAARFIRKLAPIARTSTHERVPRNVIWPDATRPIPHPLTPAPADKDDLSRFEGYDAIVITYTSAEAAALAALLTPGWPISTWYEYRHKLQQYTRIVTGPNAPFNSKDPRDARYRHSLGLYFPCTIGRRRVLLLKSGLHLDYDSKVPGPIIPINKMLTEAIQAVAPRLVITTGTGGGIGANVKLGDVIIAGKTLFDCKHQFKHESWARSPYKTTPVSARALGLMTTDLLQVNAARIATATPIPGRAVPKIWSGETTTIVSTDKFAFDTSSNKPFGLHGLGQVCDMGDATVGQVMQRFKNIEWYAIRNASDPQIPDADLTYEQADREAGEIYRDYGAFTTAASVIATWAIIAAS